MIALYLIASHLVGDFIFQTRWQAAGKFTDARARGLHALTYTLAFVPVAFASAGWPDALQFLAGIFIWHAITDSRRFRSTLGDVVQWKLDYRRDPETCAALWLEDEVSRVLASGPESPGWIGETRAMVAKMDTSWPPPNPWPACGLMIDQTLHIVQIAVLAGIFLR